MNESVDQLVPGTFVRSPANPDWGLGQVQSAIGGKVTVNFEHRGKLVLHLAAAPLVVVEPDAKDGNR
jgi:3-dehydroquinate synthetase